MQSLFKTNMAFLALFALPALGADIIFREGDDCTGQPLYGITKVSTVMCYNLTAYEEAGSIDMNNFGPSQSVRFFHDDECMEEMYSTAQDTCYVAAENDKINAFTITNSTVTPAVEKAASNSTRDGTSTDVVPYGVKLSNYRGLQPVSFAGGYTNSFIATLFIATAGALSFSTAGIGAYSAITTGAPLSIYSAVAGLIGTALSYAAYYFVNRAATSAQSHIDGAGGGITDTYHNVKRGALSINDANAQYMHSALNVSGSPAVFTNKMMKRELESGVHLSPIYELPGEDGSTYHIAAFYNPDTDSYLHHITWDHATQVDKRQDQDPGYDNVMASGGGYDFSFCAYSQSADRSVFQGRSLQDFYSSYYKDFTCLVAESDLNKQQFLADMYNGDGVIVGEVNVAPYQNGGPVQNNAYVITQCSSQTGMVSQSCIN